VGLTWRGHSFGIVSELTVRAYPEVNKGVHWTGTLVFEGTRGRVEEVVKTIAEMGIGWWMACLVIFTRMPPEFQLRPSIFPFPVFSTV
jgi:hypothetical protein